LAGSSRSQDDDPRNQPFALKLFLLFRNPWRSVSVQPRVCKCSAICREAETNARRYDSGKAWSA